MTGLVQRGINRGSVVVAVVILLLAAVVATFLVLRDDDRDPGAVSAAGEEGVWDPYAKLADGGRGATTAVRAQWEPVAEKFASVFLDPGRRAAWLSALRPLVADQLYAGLEEVEPRKVPDGTPGTLELVASGNRFRRRHDHGRRPHRLAARTAAGGLPQRRLRLAGLRLRGPRSGLVDPARPRESPRRGSRS